MFTQTCTILPMGPGSPFKVSFGGRIRASLLTPGWRPNQKNLLFLILPKCPKFVCGLLKLNKSDSSGGPFRCIRSDSAPKSILSVLRMTVTDSHRNYCRPIGVSTTNNDSPLNRMTSTLCTDSYPPYPIRGVHASTLD